MAEFEEWRIQKNYRLISNKDGKRLELTSNIASIDIAGDLRDAMMKSHPFLEPITIEEYSTYWF